MPAAPYVTLAEMKAWLGESGTTNDAAIQSAIDAASSAIERHCGRDFAPGQTTEEIWGTGAFYVFPRRTPITAVASCVISGVTIPVAFNSISVKRQDGLFFGIHDTVTLTYTAGASPIDADVVLATKLTAQAIYGAPAMDQNLGGESTVGFGSSSYAPQGPGGIPRAALGYLEKVVRRF
jgi:hypothetical protein